MKVSASSETAPNQPWTVLRLIRWTADYLSGKGVDSPRLDAEVMLADLLRIDRVGLYLEFDRPLDPAELAGFRERVKRRAAREPVAYILGRKEFYSLEFEVGPGVLVPRPETELLVEESLKLIRRRWPEGEPLRLADLGTGSGAVAVTLAHELETAEVWAVDISDQALEFAKRNASRHQIGGRLHFVKSDLLAALAGAGEPFHLIVANLPYVPHFAFSDMAPDVRDYEPVLALDGGADGLDLIRRAAEQARPLLGPGGALLLEVWPTHGPDLRELAERLGYGRVEMIRDLAGRERIAVLDTATEVN